MQARLVCGDHTLTVDATDGCTLGDHQPRQIFGKMTAGSFGVKHVTEDGQRFLHDGRKVHDGRHGGSLLTAWKALGKQRGILHYTPSSLLCKTSALTWNGLSVGQEDRLLNAWCELTTDAYTEGVPSR